MTPITPPMTAPAVATDAPAPHLDLGRAIAPGARILVAMSGGVDSALCAVLLQQAGYQCVGINMRTYHPNADDLAAGRKFQSCCSPDDAQDARAVASDADMPFYVLDLEEDFHAAVVEPFINEYLHGRTPNPCVLCNNHLKLGVLMEKARMWGCDYVATGHYARVHHNPATGRHELRRAADPGKDQTYYLFGLSQAQLAMFLCPLADIDKPTVRALARQHGIAIHDKPDSQEICFVPSNDYRQFLRKRVGEQAVRPGDIVTTNGTVLGRHDGIAFYTIGQRRGIGVSSEQPLYVIDILPEENLMVVGHDHETLSSGLIAHNLNWVAMENPGAPFDCLAQIRYRSAPTPARATPGPTAGQWTITLNTPQRAVTPGQAVVLYDQTNTTVLAGGWILNRIP